MRCSPPDSDSPLDEQLSLPLEDEDQLGEDNEPESILGAPGLADATDERLWLEAIIDAAGEAARRESKIARLIRLLSRIKEPAIVFTEYRDTLTRIQDAVRDCHPDISMLHGGLTATERSAVQRRFNQEGSLLLATDAAAEGLNLHSRCRTVIHFELPWSPARLEQRTGRVDRIGQSRVVHEIVLVASDTAERLVLAPLARRAARAARFGSDRPRLLAALSESRVAAAVMEGTPVEPATASLDSQTVHPPGSLRTSASLEADRLADLRSWQRSAARRPVFAIPATVLDATTRSLPPGIVHVCTLALTAQDGANVHHEIVAVHRAVDVRAVRTPAEVRAVIASIDLDRLAPSLMAIFRDRLEQVGDSCARVAAALSDREHVIGSAAVSAARQLVQAGLFDRRTIRASRDRARSEADLLEETNERLKRLAACSRLTPSLELHSILLVRHTGRP